MKEYKLVLLNEDMHLSRKKDIADAENLLNQYTRQGWELQQIITPDDSVGSLIGVFYREF